MGDVAKKITGRTTDLLAICIVLGASLTFGSQIVSWWHAAPPPNSAADPALAAPGWNDALQPVDLEFGDLPVALTRQSILGDQAAAIEALVRHCQSAVKDSTAAPGPADDVEIRLLNRVAELTPAAEEPGAWQVFVADERFPLVVGVRPSAPAAPKRPGHSGSNGGVDGQSAGDRAARRLVCYGLAMPVGERTWTVFIVKGSPAGQTSPASPGNISLPPGAARTLSLRDERGSLLLGFSGNGDPEEWIRFYEDQCSKCGWARSAAWSQGNESWAARFARRDGDWVDVRFAKDRRGELTGVLQVIPQTSESKNSEKIETRP
jgi:hypothetical protein